MSCRSYLGEAVSEMVERVLRAVEQVPSGRVVSYGVVAELVGTTARNVGAVMSSDGGQVSWWRVTNSRGELPEHLMELARKRWEREGIGHTDRRCYIERHRADLAQLADDYARATADLLT